MIEMKIGTIIMIKTKIKIEMITTIIITQTPQLRRAIAMKIIIEIMKTESQCRPLLIFS